MRGGGRCWPLAVALVAGLAVIGVVPGEAVAQPVPAAAVTLDGPSPDVVGLGGVSVARDGSGGLVYVKQVLGVPHVFVSRLVGGSFQAPEQIDASLIGPSSQPVIAAGNGGLLLVAFINSGALYVADRASAAAASGAPFPIAAPASNPAIGLSNFGKGYLAFTAGGAGAHDVRAAYYDNGLWALENSPLDAVPADDAGTGTGRPAVAVSGDGVAIVAWGEGGHVYSRRVWGTAPSVVYEQADVPSLSGWSEVQADEPSVATGGDSSYADVAFHEVLASGLQQQSRVLTRRLRASQYDPVMQSDGLSTPGSVGAEEPQVVETEYGQGFVTSAHQSVNQVFAMTLGSNGAGGGVGRVDSLPSASAPDAVPAIAGLFSDLIAWQHDPGGGGSPDIRVRYAPAKQALGPELVLSSPAAGPTNADGGLAAAGDVTGNAAVAWVQGTGSSTRIVAAQLYQPPGSSAPLSTFRYARTTRPALSWSAARDQWGPVRYAVTVDGIQVAQTTATALRVPLPLTQGAHRWQIIASNPAGLANHTRTATVFLDTVAPAAKLSITGKKQAGSFIHVYVGYTDSPPPVPRSDASGVASVVVEWGDGSSYKISHGKFHAYKRRGRFRLTIVVKDRAGNTTTLASELKIARKPPPKKKKPKNPRRPVHHSTRH